METSRVQLARLRRRFERSHYHAIRQALRFARWSIWTRQTRRQARALIRASRC